MGFSFASVGSAPNLSWRSKLGKGMVAVCIAALPAALSAQTAHFSYTETVLPFTGLSAPAGEAVDSAGDVFVVDGTTGIISELPAGGGSQISVVTGLTSPRDIAVDSVGNLYVSFYSTANLLVYPAGGGSPTTLGTGLTAPNGLALDGLGHIYVADSGNNRVLKITISGGAQTTVGSGLIQPVGVAVDSAGNVYVGDYGNHRVEMITSGGTQTTIMSSIYVHSVAVDQAGNVFADDFASNTLLELPAGGSTVTVIPSTGGLSLPAGIITDSVGSIYLADLGHSRVIKVRAADGLLPDTAVASTSAALSLIFTFDTAGTGITTVVSTQGLTGMDFADAGTGTCDTQTSSHAYSIGDTCTVNVTFTPQLTRVRYGAVTLLNSSGLPIANGYVHGTGLGPQIAFLPGAQSSIVGNLSYPVAVAVDGNGDIYVTDIDNGGRALGFALSSGAYTQVSLSYFGNFFYPGGIAVDGAGNIYIPNSQFHTIEEEQFVGGGYQSTGYTGATTIISSVAQPAGVAVDAAGNLYIADQSLTHVLKETLSAGSYNQSSIGSGFSSPFGIAVDLAGNVYVADTGNSEVWKETPSGGGTYTQTLIGSGLNGPKGVAVDGNGNVFIADTGNFRLLEETLSGGVYTQSVLYTSGSSPLEGVAVDSSGNVYVTDNDNNRVLKIDYSDPPSLTFASAAVGATSSDSPQTVTVKNIGNRIMTFPAPSSGDNPTISTSFTWDSVNGTCPLVTSSASSLAVNQSCTLPISFVPTATGSLSGALVLTDNHLNAPGPGYATQAILLSGTGLAPPPATTTVLTSSNPNAVVGASVTFTATISPTPDGGTVTFHFGGNSYGPMAVTAGVATYATSALPLGANSVTAVYSGDVNFSGSTSAAFSEQVSPPATTTTLAITPGSSEPAGTTVTMTATVTGGYPGAVLFCNATASLCEGAALLGVAQLTSGGTATFRYIPGVGTYSIAARFNGTDAGATSVSAAQSLTITGAASYLSFTSIAAAGNPGDYTLTGTVSGFGIVAPGGTVNFLNTTASTTIGSATLDPSTRASTFGQAAGSPMTLGAVQTAVREEASGDFNGDGIPDLVALGSDYQSHVYVLLGVGDGTFQAPVSYAVGSYAHFVTVADVNNDGHPDIIVTNTFSGNVGVLLGNGNGTFGAQTTFSVGSSPSFVAVGDLNGDGNLDLVVANTGDNTVGVLLGNGMGGFDDQVTYAVGAASGVAIGDFNGDGKPDLAVSNAYVYPTPLGTISLLMGVGDGTFMAATSMAVPTGVDPSALLAADLRNSGKLDLVFADSGLAINPASASVYVMLGNNDGTFAASAAYPTANYAVSVSVGDINHDGILDVVVPDFDADGSGTSVSVLIGDGDGTFGAKTDYPVGGVGPYNVVLADFNGDGLLDISTSDYGTLAVTTLLQQQVETATLSNAAVYGVGPQLADASYPGDASHAASVSPTTSLIPLIVTTTALTSSSLTPLAGASVTFTATISPVPTGSPLGTVRFYSGGVLLGSGGVAISALGVATYTTTSLAVGADAITAVYSGNAAYATSTSAALTETVTLAATTTTLTSSSLTPATGASVTLTATVAPEPTGSPLGTVSFYNGTTLLGTEAINSQGVVTFSTTALPAGSDSISAIYSGNAAFATSTSSALTITVTSSGRLALSALPATVMAGGNLGTVTATVEDANGNVATNSTASVTALITGPGGYSRGATVAALAGVASFPLSSYLFTTPGTYTLTVTSNGLTTATATFTVTAVATVTTVASSNPAPTYGQSVLLTATVTPASTDTPSGTVSFYSGTGASRTLLGSAALGAGGLATLSVTLPLGPNTITAVYSGSADFAGSTSGALALSTLATTAVTLSANPTTQLTTMPIVFTAQVNSAIAGVPTGTVSFLNGSTVLATVTLTAGQPAVYSETGLSSGTYSVTASYSGDGSFLPSASTGAPIAITVSDLNLALGGDKNKSVVPGGAVTYNFPLSPVVTPTFVYNVTLAATGLPPGATYTFSPATIPAGSGTLPVAFTVQTAKTTAMLHRAPGSSRSPWFALVFGLLLPLAGAKRFRARLTKLPRMLLLLLFSGISLSLLAGLGGCGSGGFYGSPSGQTSYTITISATSGTLVRTSTVQLSLE